MLTSAITDWRFLTTLDSKQRHANTRTVLSPALGVLGESFAVDDAVERLPELQGDLHALGGALHVEAVDVGVADGGQSLVEAVAGLAGAQPRQAPLPGGQGLQALVGLALRGHRLREPSATLLPADDACHVAGMVHRLVGGRQVGGGGLGGRRGGRGGRVAGPGAAPGLGATHGDCWARLFLGKS